MCHHRTSGSSKVCSPPTTSFCTALYTLEAQKSGLLQSGKHAAVCSSLVPGSWIHGWQETLGTAQGWGLPDSPLEKQNEEPREEFWAQTSLLESEVAIF